MPIGGHNRIDYHHSDLCKAKSSLAHLKIDYSNFSDEEILKVWNANKWPRKCKNEDCETLVKTRNHFYCLSCQTSGDKNPSKKLGVGDRISKALVGKKFSEDHKNNLKWKKENYAKRRNISIDNGKKAWLNLSPEEKQSRLRNTWRKSGYHPNKGELFILSILEELFLLMV